MVITTIPAAGTVYVPNEPGELVTTATTAIRAWTDELLQISSEGLSTQPDPPSQIRSRAYRGMLVRTDPAAATDQHRVELDVDPVRCAVASAAAVDQATDWVTWRRLLHYLVDHGHDGDLVEEVVSPVSFDEATMQVDTVAVAIYIRGLESTLLSDMLTYFREPCTKYWQSWRPLAAAMDDSTSSLEVVIPPNAIRTPLSSDPLTR